MEEFEQNGPDQEANFTPYGEEYRAALRGLEAENIAEQARAVADLMNTRLEEGLLEHAEDGEGFRLYESEGDYDEVTGAAIRLVLQENGVEPDKFRTPRKRYKDGLPQTDGQLFSLREGRLTVIYDPWKGRRDFDESGHVIAQDSRDWRVYVSADPDRYRKKT